MHFGVYIYRQTEEKLLALSNVCTHLSCRVTWLEDVEYYFCPCHDGRFDITGLVIYGPPPRPLVRYETKVEEDNLYIRVVEG